MNMRRNIETTPSEILSILNSDFFRFVFLELFAAVTCVSVVVIGFYLKFKLYHPLQPAFWFGGIEDFQPRFFKPLLLPLGVIVALELALLIFW